MNIQVLPDGSSDHRPILLTLPDHCMIYNCNNTRFLTDWEGVAGDLSRITWSDGVDECAEDIDTSVRLIQSHMGDSSICWKNVSFTSEKSFSIYYQIFFG